MLKASAAPLPRTDLSHNITFSQSQPDVTVPLKGQFTQHKTFDTLFFSSINSILIPDYYVKLFPYDFTFTMILTL
jgi:hypothetical protein